MEKVVSFIPIKLNNQRLPGKNLLLLNGRPTCQYIFDTIAKVDTIDEKYVYCSDEAIVDYIPDGLNFLKRDTYLDGYEVKGLEIIEHFVRDIDADIYVLTHVTQPFTKAESIKQALNKVVSGEYDSAFSAVLLQDYMWMDGKPLNYNMKDIVRTQDLEPVYMETGAFFIFRKEVFTKLGQRIGNKPYIYEIDQFEAVDIDTAEDFKFAEAVAAYLDKESVGEVMKNIRILDCTLRDGGRIIDCAFPDQEIKELAGKLANAKIDIVEIGFLRDCRSVNYQGNSTFFTDVEQIKPFLDKTRKNVMYVAFIDYGMFDFTTLKPFDGTSIDGIRFGFTKRDFVESHDEVMQCIKIIKQKGYQLFIQGVNSLNYSDLEVLRLVDMINEVHPYSFGIVDTYGAMYMDDIDRIYSLIDHNMDSDICINFHSHNNYQLSFALAQEVIRLSKGVRQIIIDGTLSGMGKVAGNLNTELIVDYLVRKLQYDYELDNILDIIDDYIQKYSAKYSWGYSIPAMMAGIYKAHPNNIVYLTEKFRLETKDISNLLSMISPQERQRYDYDNIERIYMEYIADKIEDYDTINELKKTVEDKEAFVLVPGDSINTHKGLINKYISEHNPIIFSVNYIAEYMNSFAFFGNQKRYNRLFSERQGKNVILSSNVKSDSRTDHIVNYHSLINRGYKYFENSTIMLFNLLKKLNPDKITIAGFDGFRAGGKKNYLDASFPNERNKKEFDILNREIKEMYLEIVNTLHGKCEVKIITPSIYDKK